jgi:hypothetical protein
MTRLWGVDVVSVTVQLLPPPDLEMLWIAARWLGTLPIYISPVGWAVGGTGMV